MRTTFHSTRIVRAIDPDQHAGDNTAVVSEIIDRAGFESLEFDILLGDLVDADATFTVLVEDGDNSSLTDNAAVADADLLGTEANAGFTFAADNSVRKIGVMQTKRYARITITPASNTGAWDMGVVALLGQPRHSPSQGATGAAVTQTP